MNFKAKLFFGLFMDDLFKESLDKCSNDIKRLYIGSNQNYLCTMIYEEKTFIGKWIDDNSLYLEVLENLQNHILSMLKQIAPHYDFENKPLILVPIVDL